MNSKFSAILSCTLLIAGTTIGGGMLAMPIAAGMAGFFPSLVVMFICCLFMTLSGLLILEAALWFPPGVHFISMTNELLGKRSTQLCWVVYLFLAYASLVGYTADGGRHFESLLGLPYVLGCLAFSAVLGIILFLGNKALDKINALLFFLMLICYILLVVMGVGEVQTEKLFVQQASLSWLGVPLFIASFSYQSMLPSLLPWFKKRPQDLRYSIIGGCTLTFVIYTLWLYLIFGTLPIEGEYGFKQLFVKGIDVTEHYQAVVGNPLVGSVSRFFSFFAISTSFLGISLGLVDFLKDGLKHQGFNYSKNLLVILALFPSCILAFSNPRIFYLALDLSGSFGDSILNGLIPVALVWAGWYKWKKKPNLGIPIGKKSLIVMGAFSCLIIVAGIAEPWF